MILKWQYWSPKRNKPVTVKKLGREAFHGVKASTHVDGWNRVEEGKAQVWVWRELQGKWLPVILAGCPGCPGVESVAPLPQRRSKGNQVFTAIEGGKVPGDYSLKELNKLAAEGHVPSCECGPRSEVSSLGQLVGDETEHLTKGWSPVSILTQKLPVHWPVLGVFPVCLLI